MIEKTPGLVIEKSEDFRNIKRDKTKNSGDQGIESFYSILEAKASRIDRSRTEKTDDERSEARGSSREITHLRGKREDKNAKAGKKIDAEKIDSGKGSKINEAKVNGPKLNGGKGNKAPRSEKGGVDRLFERVFDSIRAKKQNTHATLTGNKPDSKEIKKASLKKAGVSKIGRRIRTSLLKDSKTRGKILHKKPVLNTRNLNSEDDALKNKGNITAKKRSWVKSVGRHLRHVRGNIRSGENRSISGVSEGNKLEKGSAPGNGKPDVPPVTGNHKGEGFTADFLSVTRRYDMHVPELMRGDGYIIQRNADEIFSEIVKHFSYFVNRGGGEAKLILNPPELGTLKMSVKLHNGRVSTFFIVDNPSIKEIIDSRLVVLQQNLLEQGFSLGEFDVGVRDNGADTKFFKEARSVKGVSVKGTSLENIENLEEGDVTLVPWMSNYINIEV